MRWRDLRQSTNIEDRRGSGGFGGFGGGFGRGGGMGRGGMAVGGGVGGFVVVLLVYLLGGLGGGSVDQAPVETRPYASEPGTLAPGDDSLRQFIGAVLGSTEDVWAQVFANEGRQYSPPRLVLFSDQVQSACGIAGAAVGPFYCPMDGRVYIDLSFYRQLRERLGAPGDFAQAYVIAHEIGHHIQNLLGTSDRVQQAQRSAASKAEANDLSVRLELQADYLAGVWAHHAQRAGVLETGDLEEALNAASAIGDDKLQREGQGYVVPDSFTHGTSEQRMRWFRRGLERGTLDGGDTFSQDVL